MATASVTIAATIQSLPSGTKTVGPLTISAATANGNTTDYALAVGFNTIVVPITTATPILAGATPTGCIIIPDSTNTSAMTLKGVTGDTGITMHLTNPFVLGFPSSPPVSFGITVASAATTCQIVWF